MSELINDFSLSRVQKAGAKFNLDKAKWFNGEHLKLTDDDELTDQLMPYLQEKGIELPYEKVNYIWTNYLLAEQSVLLLRYFSIKSISKMSVYF